MDLTDRYIKMCEKAVELGNLLKLGDYYTTARKNLVFHFTPEELVGDYLKPKLYGDMVPMQNSFIIWLPRQDQIQEMYRAFIESELGIIEPDTKGVFLDFVAWMKEQYHESSHICVPTNNFSSGEQLWLACLMQVKYGKKWNGEDWISSKL